MVALPIQGMAAVSKMSCGPSHHDPMAGPSVHEHDHDEDVETLQHYDPSNLVVAKDDLRAASLSKVDNSFPENSHFHKCASCSTSSACCTGTAAPPSAVTILFPFVASGPAFIAPATLVTHFIPGSLERPPRSTTT